MGQNQSAGRNNSELVDMLIGEDIIESASVELVLRVIDRGMFFADVEPPSIRYRDSAWRSEVDRLHISAPCIYAMVLEHLQPQRGQSFLNLGSGTGYFSSIVGLLIGSLGVNHGVELYPSTVEFAREKQLELVKTHATTVFDWCPPEFFVGNVFQLNTQMRYDRIYIGAKVPEGMRLQFVKLLKIGGVAILPYGNMLQRIQRSSEKTFLSFDISNVEFSTLCPPEGNSEFNRPVEIPFMNGPPSLAGIANRIIMNRVRNTVAATKVVTVRQRCSSDHVGRYPYDEAEDNMLNDQANVPGEVADENVNASTLPERSADGYTIFSLRNFTGRLRIRLDQFPENVLRMHGNFFQFADFEGLDPDLDFEDDIDIEDVDDSDESADDPPRRNNAGARAAPAPPVVEDAGAIADDEAEVPPPNFRQQWFADMFVHAVDQIADQLAEDPAFVGPQGYRLPRRMSNEGASAPGNANAAADTPHNTATSTSRQTPNRDDIDTTTNPEASNDTAASNAATVSTESAASSSNPMQPANAPTNASTTGSNATNRKRRARSSSPDELKYNRRPKELYMAAPAPFTSKAVRMAILTVGHADSRNDNSSLKIDMEIFHKLMRKTLEKLPLPRPVINNMLGAC